MERGSFILNDNYFIQMPKVLLKSKQSMKSDFSSRLIWIEQGIHISVGIFGNYSCVKMTHKVGTLKYNVIAGLDWYETGSTIGPLFGDQERAFCEQLLITTIQNFPDLLFLILNAYRDLGYEQGDKDAKARIRVAMGL